MKGLLAVLCILLAFVLVCSLAIAYSETIEIPIGDRATRTVNLNDGDKVSGHITVIPASINFSTSDPDDIIILNYANVTQKDFQFTASKTGTYTFRFENLFSEKTKSLTLHYDVQHYIFGFPQEYIILFVIVGLALVAIVVFVAMSPKP